jgi:hypothetical protein
LTPQKQASVKKPTKEDIDSADDDFFSFQTREDIANDVLVAHLKFTGVIVKEGKVLEVWFGCTKHSNMSWALDQDYLLDQSNICAWSVDFLSKYCHNQDDWTQVKPGISATTAQLLAIPNLQILLAMKNDKLTNRWVLPSSLGNPVVAYHQHDKDTCLLIPLHLLWLIMVTRLLHMQFMLHHSRDILLASQNCRL